MNRLLLTALFCCFIYGCGGNNDAQSPAMEAPFIINPIIEDDDFFVGSHWNDPHVLYIEDQFVMYASSDIAFDGTVRIYRLVSSDGINWDLNPSSPVLEQAASGWDSHSVETPAVVYYENNYHLFYTGYDVPYDYKSDGDDATSGNIDDDIAAKHFKIGHAISADGINFNKQASSVVEPTAPYQSANLDFNQYVVGEPAPVVYNGQIYLYFTALGYDQEASTLLQTIGLMTYDDENWGAPQVALKPDNSLYPRDQYIGYSTPNAVVIDDVVHLYVDVVIEETWKQDKIHRARSNDGIGNWVQDSGPLLEREDFTWTKDEIRSPSVLVHGGWLYVYFAGHTLTPELNLAIGLAFFPLL